MRRMETMDGNTAASKVSYFFTEVSTIYPITPSSSMAEHIDEWVTIGKKNLFGKPVKVIQMQSEAGAAGAMHGSLQAGALTSTYTSSQGLLLMIPNMYKMAGELLPGVIHVAARALATSSLNIFGDHQDVMAARQTGFAMLIEGSVQEVMDLSPVAHIAALKGRVPFMNIFDGFRTSHEIQKIEVIEDEELESLLDFNDIQRFKSNSLNPSHPVTRGTAQNSDIYFQTREAVNSYYERLPDIVEEEMKKITKITGREYHCFDYYGDEDAENIIIAMGSVTEVIEETVDYLMNKKEKVGLLRVRLYRPFIEEKLLKAIPSTVKKIAVLDRTKEPGSTGEPLYLDVVNSYYKTDKDRPLIIGGRFGLGSKDPTPGDIASVFQNLNSENPKRRFTVGINDDVTNLSLSPIEGISTTPEGTKSCMFWGLGSDGTVGANKNAIKIIGDNTNMYAQGYFYYDSKKSGGLTVSHLRFGNKPIKSSYLIDKADFIACHNQAYVYSYNVLKGLKENSSFLLNTNWDKDELTLKLPAHIKRYLYKKNIDVYIINAVKIAEDIGLGGRINMIMQAAFFKIANIIPIDEAIKYLKEAVKTSYGKKGDKIVSMNNKAIDLGVDAIVKINIPKEWENAENSSVTKKDIPKFIKEIVEPISREEGNKLPVSTFIENGMEDGTFMSGTSAYEKRGIAVNVPEWQSEKCIQCNQCAYICPHAVIRPYILDEDEKENAPESFKLAEAKGLKLEEKSYYTIAISTLDCTGCGNCADICPAPGKALIMKPQESQHDQIPVWEYIQNNVKEKTNPLNKYTLKGSQFEKPLYEFSGACAGCGETAYAKLVTQLYGDRMMIANATGCSSIWASSVPSTAYTKNTKGYGPAWANSLFEDNAEFGLGMHIASKTIRERLESNVRKAINEVSSDKYKDILTRWLEGKDEGEGSRERAEQLIDHLTKEDDLISKEILRDKDYLVKRSQWIFGGDGWAYDIGYGGLDHVLALGEDVNVLVFDTEIYSNTGGQASKSTPTGAVAKFAAAGKKTRKKDLGIMAMSYGYVYVAQISMGADKNQTIKAIKEAESYKGPSLIIAYSPCISHGIKKGMSNSSDESKRAVDSGYWSLYRYNPEEEKPFKLDSKEPTLDFEEFLLGEVRYSSLTKTMPEEAERLFRKTEKEAKERYNKYKKLEDL